MERLVLGKLVASHQASLRPLDHLPIFERPAQRERLAEPGDGQVEHGCQLRRAERFEKIGHYAGRARPIDQLLPRVAGEEHHGTARLDHLSRRLDTVSVRQTDGKDGDVGARPPHEREGIGTPYRLADHLAPRRPDGGAKGRARALVIVQNRDPPAWVGLRPATRHGDSASQARCQSRVQEINRLGAAPHRAMLSDPAPPPTPPHSIADSLTEPLTYGSAMNGGGWGAIGGGSRSPRSSTKYRSRARTPRDAGATGPRPPRSCACTRSTSR